MAKSLIMLEARKLRKRGVSVKTIAKILGISKGTVSLWVRDIILTIEQLEKLKKNSIEGAERGRLKSALLQKEKRLKLIEDLKAEGIKTLERISEKELLIAGLALYWGEGRKGGRRVEFCNSDPKTIVLLKLWLKKCFNVKNEDLFCRVGINEIHLSREQLVREYWSKVADIPLNQFRRTSFKRIRNKKIYENFNRHYGTLTLGVVKSAHLSYRIVGLIEGLYQGSVA